MKLKDIIQNITSGGTPSTHNDKYYNGDIPWLRTQEVNFNFIKDTEMKITSDGLNNSSAKWIPSNSVIVAMYGNSAGRVAYSKIPLTTNQACCNITVDESKADSLFLYYYLVKNYSNLEKLANGGAQQNLNVGIIKDFPFPDVPLPEQHRISNILSSFDNKIELLRKENNTLEDIAQSIFKEWFVNTKEKQIEISNLIEFNPQLSIRKKQSASYIEMADLFTNSSSISKIVKRPYTSGSKFQNNDILFARVTPCLENGKTGIVKGLGSEDIGWGSTEFIVMRGKDSITYPFVYCLARNKQFRQFAQKEMIGTSGRQRVPVNKLQGYLIPQPTTKKLDSFNQISLLIFERIEKNSIKAGILIKMKNNLLSKFFKE